MKAIKVTQELKDANVELFKNYVIDNIRQFKEIPKSFFSLTYNAGQRTDGYHTLSNSVHEGDGFYNLLTPVFDPNLKKLGDIYFNGIEFTYNLINITQEEIDAKKKDKFKNNLQGVFAYATTPDGTKEYAIKIGNDGKVITVLIR